MLELSSFSETLLELEELTQASTIDQFQYRVLVAVQRLVPFDNAWWGVMSAEEDGFTLNNSYLFDLPETYINVWEEVNAEDLVARSVSLKHNETIYFDQKALLATPGLATLTGTHRIGQVFCSSVQTQPLELQGQGSFMFLSLYRSFGATAFSGTDRLLIQYLVRHLFTLWANNRAYQMQRLRSTVVFHQYAMAIIDREPSQVLNAEPEFFNMMRQEWPCWGGTSLPMTLSEKLKGTAESTFKFTNVVFQRYDLGKFIFLLARKKTPVDTLSKRESDIADQFSVGKSYKEVARQSGISPATVRHHLRTIYSKLGVTDKGEMSFALKSQPTLLDQGELLHRYNQLRPSIRM